MADTAAAPAPAAAEKKGGGLPTILLIVNAVLLVGVLGAVVMLIRKPAAPAPAAAAKEGGEAKAEGGEHGGGEGKSEGGEGKAVAPPGAGPTLRIADFVVHLRNPEVDRYARLSFELEVPGDHEKDYLKAREAQIRDAFIAYLSDRTAEDLRGSAGLELIKTALLAKCNEIARDARVRQLFITDFVIQ
ncbi:MAG: flagellar basal body-associated FliL family protein [Deltaproteobacteria bacterium]|nr:flagellar basal body-associated FliL family protein [Deltaproteobacteria bacterium]